MKKVVIIGGAGNVGRTLIHGLMKKHEIIAMDQSFDDPNAEIECIEVDATNYHELLNKMPKDTDTIINLLATKTGEPVPEIDKFEKMTDVFFKASYYILLVASHYNIPQVIFASSNHVTDYYEEEGNSLLGREINVTDYPYMRSLYGVLKLASEQAGFIFSQHRDVSVINIRIASVPPGDEKKAIQEKPRLEKTLLSDKDLVELFGLAIESKSSFETYYGVSDNDGKPWDTSDATRELGFRSKENSEDVLNSHKNE
ncbi:NAD-dependent epimerase/dehydratase family protein [Evansella sp. AB-rgal1]|uniref:NAD-dependent epimerase/dehydratase family protein n=1 Tax=Evansella sp. AB-rgal1 TaxID=3242696 RepID=UPI00359CED67